MSLAPKIDEIAHTLNNVDADIALFTETWLSGCVPDSPINIKGYQLFRRDRVGWQHGGVCMYVKGPSARFYLTFIMRIMKLSGPTLGPSDYRADSPTLS